MKKKYLVSGMTCASCSAHVEKAIRTLPEVEKAEVSLLTNSVTVTFTGENAEDSAVIRAVEQAGYGASLPGQGENKNPSAAPEREMSSGQPSFRLRLWVSFSALVPMMVISMRSIANLSLFSHRPPVTSYLWSHGAFSLPITVMW